MQRAVVALSALAVIADCGNDASSVSTGGAPSTRDGGSIVPTTPTPPAPPAPVTTGWSRRFDGSAFESGYSRRLDLLVDRSDNIYLVGDFKGALDLGAGKIESAGQGDLLLAKFDAEGRLLFCERFGDGADQIYAGAAIDPDGDVVIAGVFGGTVDFGGGPLRSGYRDVFLAKLDPEGKPIWSKRFGGEGTVQWASAVAVGRDGSVVLAGNQEGNIDYGGLSLRTKGVFLFVVKFDPDGRPLWGKTLGGSGDQEAIAVAVGPSGDVVLGGNAKRAIVDGVNLRGKGMMDIMLARWSAGGELRWAGIFGDPDDQWLSSLSLGPDEEMILGGTFRGTLDFRGAPLSTAAQSSYEFFLTSLDKDGQARFSRSFPTGGAVTADTSGNVVIAGSFEGQASFAGRALTSAGGKDIFVLRLRADGEPLAAYRAGDAKDQRATAVAVDRRGRVLLLGFFDGTLDVGCGPMKSQSGRDLFLARLPRP